MTDILKLAEQAGIPFNKYGLVGCDSCETDIDDALQRFATLIREQHTKDLIGAGVEPYAYETNRAMCELSYVKGEITSLVKPLYTAEALAARVARMQGEIDGLKAKFAVNPTGYIRHEDIHGDEVGPPTPCYSEPPAPYGLQVKRAIAAEDALTALQSKVAQLESDADRNAPWLTEAHALCTDQGIPQGSITGRIAALREKVAQFERECDSMKESKREHITDGTPCWCNPDTTYTDPETGSSVIVHKEMQ